MESDVLGRHRHAISMNMATTFARSTQIPVTHTARHIITTTATVPPECRLRCIPTCRTAEARLFCRFSQPPPVASPATVPVSVRVNNTMPHWPAHPPCAGNITVTLEPPASQPSTGTAAIHHGSARGPAPWSGPRSRQAAHHARILPACRRLLHRSVVGDAADTTSMIVQVNADRRTPSPSRRRSDNRGAGSSRRGPGSTLPCCRLHHGRQSAVAALPRLRPPRSSELLRRRRPRARTDFPQAPLAAIGMGCGGGQVRRRGVRCPPMPPERRGRG